jgi:hypothetical protein
MGVQEKGKGATRRRPTRGTDLGGQSVAKSPWRKDLNEHGS